MSETDSAEANVADHTVATGPVTSAERIISLDVLRGVAILGILVMNIYAFAMPFIAYANPTVLGGLEAHNMGTWFFTHILFDQKFLSIFAMLFGAGMILMTGRAEARGARYGRLYYRRLFWLLVIGAVHGYLIWMGDILFAYAAIGMLAFLFRRRSPRALIIIACLLLPLALFMSHGMAIFAEQMVVEAAEITELKEAGEAISEEQEQLLEEWQQSRAFMSPNDEDLQKDLDAYRGGYFDIVKYRAPIVLSMQIFMTLFFGISRIASLMLFGMALMKLGVFSGERSTAFYRNMMLLGYAIGLPLTVYSAIDLQAHGFDAVYVLRSGGIWNYVGSLIVAFGHIGLVMLIVKTGVMQRLMRKFAAVGRMALTNYLMHSVILTTVFYGYGLGLYGTIPRFWQMGFVVAVIGLQLVLSSWWLNRYRFGPVEWLWRSLTYWKRQPMRIE